MKQNKSTTIFACPQIGPEAMIGLIIASGVIAVPAPAGASRGA